MKCICNGTSNKQNAHHAYVNILAYVCVCMHAQNIPLYSITCVECIYASVCVYEQYIHAMM